MHSIADFCMPERVYGPGTVTCLHVSDVSANHAFRVY